MNYKFLFLGIILSLSSCIKKQDSHKEYVDLSFNSWKSATESTLKTDVQIDELTRLNMSNLFKHITKADFDELKKMIKVENFHKQYFLLQSYEGEVASYDLHYIIQKNNSYYWSSLKIGNEEKTFTKGKFVSKVDFSELIDKKVRSELAGLNVIITYKVDKTLDSKYLILNDEILNFMNNISNAK